MASFNARLTSYTPSQYSSTYRASNYLYKPSLSTLRSPSYSSSSSYLNTRHLGSSYYSTTGNSLKSTSYSSNLNNNSYSSPGSFRSNYSTSVLGNDHRSSYDSQIRRKSAIDSLDVKSEACPSWRNEPEDEKRRVGIVNLGNTCFMNSILQCLCHTQPLVDYCLHGSYRKDLNYSSATRGDLIKVFADFVKTLLEAKSAVSPTQLRTEIQKYAPTFMGYNQQDAQEFLRYFMQGLHDDIKRKKHSFSNDYGDSWRKYQDLDDSLIVDLFAGQLKSTLQCTNCRYSSVTHDPFWDLSLPIPEDSRTSSLRQCFSLFSSPEVLDEQNKAFCEKCKQKNQSSKKIEVHKFPKILVIHLKRFSTSGYARKINIMVDCPTILRNLSEFSSRNGYGCSDSYTLYGVVDHMGSNNSGHYVARCKNPCSKEWNEFSDTKVSKTTDIITRNTYMLFYIKE